MSAPTASYDPRPDQIATARHEAVPIGANAFPAGPVLRVLRARAARDHVGLEELADQLAIPVRTMFDLLTRRSLRWVHADRLAVALGRHPCEIWPDWFAEPGR